MNRFKYILVGLLLILHVSCYKYQAVPIERHFWVPNTFTPNNDNLNDYFYIKPAFGVDIRGMELTIFDHNLQVLHTYHGDFLYPAWDGKSNGVELPQGIYEYQILYQASEDSVYYDYYSTKSTIQLVREE